MMSPAGAADLPLVGIVVLNWHGRLQTIECLRALAALDYPRREIFLVDNGEQEFTPEEVRRLADGAHYQLSATNLGFAGGANLGMRAALAAGAGYVWFINNDAVPDPAALTELVAAARAHPGNGIIGPKIVQRRDPSRIDSIALHIDTHRGRVYLIGHDEVDHGQYDQWLEAEGVTGCAMLVSRTVCEQTGGFDADFFAYFEDADLCLRARAAGFRVAVAPRARVLHDRPPARHGRQSVSSLYYAARNHLMLMRRHSAAAGAGRLAVFAYIVALNLAYALQSGRRRRARLQAVWRGVCDYRRGVVGAAPNEQAMAGLGRDRT